MRRIADWPPLWWRRLLCWSVGCRVDRMQRGQGLLTCRDCGRAWRYWRKW